MPDHKPDPKALGAGVIEVPESARARTMHERIDYENAVSAEVTDADAATAGQWIRAIMEEIPQETRQEAMGLWTGHLALALGPYPAEGHVLGWPVVQDTPGFVLLRAVSSLGFQGELWVERTANAVTYGSFIQFDTDEARQVWSGVEHMHNPAMVTMVDDAVESVGAGTR